MKNNESGADQMKRRAEAALKRVQAASSTPHAPKDGANRVQNNKGNKVQPAKQRNRLQKGR
jgi:hypothetical protein